MRARIAPLSIQSQCVLVPKSFCSYQSAVCQVFLSSPSRSNKSLRFQSAGHRIKICCCAVLDERFDKHDREGSSQDLSLSGYEYNEEDSFEMNKWASVTSEARTSLSRGRIESHRNKSFVPLKFDFLEPMMVGIRPEPPEWPERQAILRRRREQKASFDLPFSVGCCSVNKAISCMFSILVEIQSHALQMRGVLFNEDMEIITGKVQTEMHSSFLWLFEEVFSTTPELMIRVMILLADYSFHSISHGIKVPEPTISPLTVKLEPDDYTEFHRTDLMYQLSLSHEPNNSLLLCNYAQFLHFVVRDYDRAEESYKRAIEVEPEDAECLCQYANFLWIIRNDFWNAEERYLEALATEPNNPFYASKYANFLWNTGGEETCYPLDSPSNENKTANL